MTNGAHLHAGVRRAARTDTAHLPRRAAPQLAVRLANRQHANKLGACDDTRWWWQQRRKKQPWLRFHPEVGDQVLLGFRHGDSARPYVMGSLFNGVTGSGGFAANHKKSLTTRSGSTVTFDDTAHTILLQTTRANKIFVDELNGTITISSAEEVNVNTKNVNINASENMNVNVGKNFTMQVGEQSSVSIEKDSSVSVNGNAMQNVGKDNHTYIAGDHISHIDKDTILNVGGSIKGNIMENATFETKGITTIWCPRSFVYKE